MSQWHGWKTRVALPHVAILTHVVTSHMFSPPRVAIVHKWLPSHTWSLSLLEPNLGPPASLMDLLQHQTPQCLSTPPPWSPCPLWSAATSDCPHDVAVLLVILCSHCPYTHKKGFSPLPHRHTAYHPSLRTSLFVLSPQPGFPEAPVTPGTCALHRMRPLPLC